MRIRTRLTFWYAGVLCLSLLLITGRAYIELHEQMRRGREVHSAWHALREACEIIYRVGLPAILLGLAGGWWLTRRTLRPLAELTRAATGLDEASLNQPLPRSGNGDELDDLAAVLNSSQVRLHDSFQRIRDFTLHASHELKTPLTVLHGELETALRTETMEPGTRARVVSQLEEVDRLCQIVDGLTLLTTADAGRVRLPMAAVLLDELVRDNFADALILAEPQAIKVELTTCDQVSILGNSHRLRQLLLNLADNAVKYNQESGRIVLALQAIDGQACFSIGNSGPGIAAENLPRVFDRFFRGEPAHGHDREGCGLGLSIAQWIVQAHDGSIAVESADSWTTVTVRLPAIRPQRSALS